MSAALNSLLLQWNRCVASTLSDGDLVRSYLRDHAEEPFRLLVERHGGMVLGVCRHRLADAHAAEDAFQATFLLLARRAGSIRRPESVAAWLHRTAIRVCTKARRARIRRQAREVPLSACVTREESYSTSRSSADVLFALEEEVERLPERYRTPLLLCYWQGMTQAEAARCLGCSEGSIKARLERGRKQLAKRLTQRGLAPQAILVAPLAGARVPRVLLVRTVALTPEGAAIPTEVATLVKGVTASLGSTSRYVVGALVTAVAFTLGGTAVRGPQRIETPAAVALPMSFALLCGSGMATTQSLFGFFVEPARSLGQDTLRLGAIVALAASAGRTLSPAAAVTLLCASQVEVDPLDLVRRLALPLLAGQLALLLAHAFLR